MFDLLPGNAGLDDVVVVSGFQRAETELAHVERAHVELAAALLALECD